VATTATKEDIHVVAIKEALAETKVVMGAIVATKAVSEVTRADLVATKVAMAVTVATKVAIVATKVDMAVTVATKVALVAIKVPVVTQVASVVTKVTTTLPPRKKKALLNLKSNPNILCSKNSLLKIKAEVVIPWMSLIKDSTISRMACEIQFINDIFEI